MRPKILALLAGGHRVRVIHPIAVDRWIVQIDIDGVMLARRRSPRHGGPADIVGELVSFPELLAHPRFEIEVLLTREEEYRRHEPGRCWRRRGWTVVERRLVAVVDRMLIAGPDDLVRLLPEDLPGEFTTADLAQRLGRPRRTAQQLAYCLRKAGLVVATGKHGHGAAYRLVPSPDVIGPEA
jgi:hypothetical protein